MVVHWSEDGEHLWLGLDSHNSLEVGPDDVLALIPMEPRGMLATRKADTWVLPPRPQPKVAAQNPYACSDGGCVLLIPDIPKGQHTNAGCRCIPLTMTPDERVNLRHGIRWLATHAAANTQRKETQ